MVTQELAQEQATRYYIDLQWYNEHNRSFQVMAQARMCRSCQAKLGTAVQERVPKIDPKTGRVVFELQSVPYGSNPLSVIRSCCSKERYYITPETPIAEAIFRVLLANGNQPSDAETIREQLSNWISLLDRPHGYSAEIIAKIIEHDTYYGLRPFPTSA